MTTFSRQRGQASERETHADQLYIYMYHTIIVATASNLIAPLLPRRTDHASCGLRISTASRISMYTRQKRRHRALSILELKIVAQMHDYLPERAYHACRSEVCTNIVVLNQSILPPTHQRQYETNKPKHVTSFEAVCVVFPRE